MPEVDSVFEPLLPQWRFLTSSAKVRGYGGAMGGGKSRCLCELAWDLLLTCPGIEVVVARQSHVSIIDSTRKTFMEQVLVREAVDHTKESGGQDFVRLKNGSTVHFIGLDDPGRQFSREIGFAIFDEAHQIREQSVVLVNTRLRQRCPDCAKARRRTCDHYPHGMALGFNPENPGHWLYKWFVEGATPTAFGYAKSELFPKDAIRPIGDMEFVIAKATDNSYLPEGYVEEQLGGLPKLLRDRYLEGQWIYISGRQYFDHDALVEYSGRIELPVLLCVSEGDPAGTGVPRIRLRPSSGDAPWWVWRSPVRERDERDEWGDLVRLPAHRYVVSVDVSSGTSNDYSAIQVLDVDTYGQVAEFQGLLDMDLVAREAFRAAVVYNGAVLVVETTGGWGFAAVDAIKKLVAAYRGPVGSKPKLYTRRIWDRLSRRFTDKMGWDTTTATRGMMLTQLEQCLRERDWGFVSSRLHTEMAGFVWPEKRNDGGPYQGVPSAQPGANDDLVMALAIGVAVVLEQPRELRRPVERQGVVFAKTGF